MTRRWSLRSMSDTELLQLQEASRERATWNESERPGYPAPAASNSCLAAAVWWTIAVLRQDHPLFLTLGVLAIVWQVLDAIAGVFGSSILRLVLAVLS